MPVLLRTIAAGCPKMPAAVQDVCGLYLLQLPKLAM
jgi:hypothetical protein